MDKKIRYLIISIAIMIIVIITGTFAWLSFRSNKTAMVLTIGDINRVQVTLQPYQINANFVPRTAFLTNDSNNKVVNIEAVNNTSNKKRIRLYYDINSIDEDLVSNNFQYVITRKVETNGSFSTYKTGNFSSAVAGQEFEILNEKIPENSTYEYKVYLWLYGYDEENSQDVSFNGELRANVNYENYIIANDQLKIFNTSITRGSIESVTFQNTIPDNISNDDQPIDISLNKSNDVIAYFRDSDGNSKYEMYIAADGSVIATSLKEFFSGFTALETITNINYLDTSKTTDMSNAFSSCLSLGSLDLSSFDTSNVTNMDEMFAMSHLTSLNLSSFDTSKVTTMEGMFFETDFISLDLRNFDTSNVTNMSITFSSCQQMKTLDLSSFNTSRVTRMDDMFGSDNKLETIYVSDRWDTSSVTNSSDMFWNCYKLPNYNSSFIDKTNAHYNTGGYLTYKPFN